MKHVFLIHSSTTYYSAIGTIERLNLDQESIVFLYTRSFVKVHHEFNINIESDCSVFYDNFVSLNKDKILNFFKNVRYADKLIMDILDRKRFLVYVPQSSNLFYQLLITHEYCNGYHFIEEGIGNYREELLTNPSIVLSYKWRIVKAIFNFFSNRFKLYSPFLGTGFRSNKKPEYFMFKEVDFVNVSKIKISKKLKSYNCIHKLDAIIVLSPLIEEGILEDYIFYDVLDKIIDYCILHGKDNVGLKFHPNQSEVVKNQSLKILSDKLPITVLDLDFDTESYIIETDGSLFIGYDSSLLFYAQIFNSKNLSVSFIRSYYKLVDKKKISEQSYFKLLEIFEKNNVIVM